MTTPTYLVVNGAKDKYTGSYKGSARLVWVCFFEVEIGENSEPNFAEHRA